MYEGETPNARAIAAAEPNSSTLRARTSRGSTCVFMGADGSRPKDPLTRWIIVAQDAPNPRREAPMATTEKRKRRVLSLLIWFAIGAGLVALTKSQASEPRATPDRPVRIFSQCYGGENCIDTTGKIVPAALIHQILFVREPCPLAPNDHSLHRAWFRGGGLRCWGALSDGTYVILGLNGLLYPQNAILETLPRAMLKIDGSALITEPQYNSRTAQNEAVLKQIERMQAAINAKP